MQRHIRILSEQSGGPSFRKDLEAKARELAKDHQRDAWDSSILPVIEREIVLTLDHIDRMREIGKQLSRSLLRSECYVGTELIQMEQRTPRYSPYRFPEREKLQRRLLAIEQERRRLSVAEEEQLRALHDRLLSLLNKHAQLRL